MRLNLLIVVGAILVSSGIAIAEMRTWSDATGKFKVDAELISKDNGKVQLRTSEGKEIAVPIKKLHPDDQKFLGGAEANKKPSSTASKAELTQELRDLADKFFGDLRTADRLVARAMLSEAAQTWVEKGKSPLSSLPTPDKPASAVKAGAVTFEGNAVTVSARIRVGGKNQKAELHLRKETDSEKWHVIAISAKLGDKAKIVRLEPTEEELAALTAPPEAPAPAPAPVDPLAELVGKPIELKGVTLKGDPVSLDDFKGKVVLIDFWATWCGPCIQEIPNVRANWDKYHEKGFEVIAVSVDGDLEALKAFVEKESPPWTVVADAHPANKASMSGKFGIQGIPAFILVGRDGNVAAIHCRGNRLGAKLEELLKDI